MRVRDHVVLTTPIAALLRPLAGRRALGLWAGGVLIDADHYLWFCLRRGRLNPVAAVRFFGEAEPPQQVATRLLHSPAVLLAALVVGVRRRPALPVALGMALHVGLDMQHQARLNRARAAALRRDDCTCRRCGTRGPEVGTHLVQQPWLLPSYRIEHFVSLCSACHQAAHAGARSANGLAT